MSGVLVAIAGAVTGNPLTAVCDPTAVSGVFDTELDVGITDVATVTPTGGVAPYTHSWAKVSGFDFTPVGGTSAAFISFQFTGSSHRVAVYRDTVTDHIGQTTHADLSVTAN